MKDRSILPVYILLSIIAMGLAGFLAMLKLAGQITISWWLVTLPVWGLITFFAAFFSFMFGVICIRNVFSKKKKWITKNLYE